jgi:hypothetical protein
MEYIFDGFWLPKDLREKFITPNTNWEIQYHKNGLPSSADTAGAIGARWPLFSKKQWKQILKSLKGRKGVADGDFLNQMQAAILSLSERFNDPQDPLSQAALSILPNYTGFSRQMIEFTLNALDLTPLDTLAQALKTKIPTQAKRKFVAFENLSGRVRFYPSGIKKIFSQALPNLKTLMSFKADHPRFVLGYAAGNVIGTSQLIALLGQLSAYVQVEEPPSFPIPPVLIKNSRREPLFTPILFSALEDFDSTLVDSVALLVWDYEDIALQEMLIKQADLVIAAASDDTIEQIDAIVKKVQTKKHPIRFHKHGHKVSFTTIGETYLQKETKTSQTEQTPFIDIVTLLSAVDSAFWDQYGCLSSRIHFVETNGKMKFTGVEYGMALTEKMRLLSVFLPRSASIPLSQVHNRFEGFSALTTTGKLHLCSTYSDDFIVAVDERPWPPPVFHNLVNTCVQRTIIVRPVSSILEITNRYLRWIPPENLQTMSTAIDGPLLENWSNKFTEFANRLGKCGVTAIRTIGRGAFPFLAYSWDGYLPQDLSAKRQPGHFTTVEFDSNYKHIMDTYALYQKRGLQK